MRKERLNYEPGEEFQYYLELTALPEGFYFVKIKNEENYIAVKKTGKCFYKKNFKVFQFIDIVSAWEIDTIEDKESYFNN